MQMAEEALSQADITSQEVTKMALKIRAELGYRVDELQSFSPEELSNIPRQSKWQND